MLVPVVGLGVSWALFTVRVLWTGEDVHVQVIDESDVIVKVVVFPVPVVGTLPVPVQPVHVQTRFPSVTGLVPLAVTDLPSVYV